MVEIARVLHRAGYDTWCVGGAVRDALIGESNLDWDLATSATPPEVRRLFRRTVPVGIEFGTIGVFGSSKQMYEVTTFRRDVHTDGRHAVVEFGASLDDDLARRDFTINAIAYNPMTRQLHDPFNGRLDLSDGIVRAVGDAGDRMREDRLRALRALRFAARFEFAINDDTWTAIVQSAPFLARLSPERVKQELEKTMEQVQRPSLALARWRDAGAFAALVPALAEVSDNTLLAVDALPRPGRVLRPLRKGLRLAALFSGADGKSAESAFRALRFSNQDTSQLSSLVDRWWRFGPFVRDALAGGQLPDDPALRRLAANVGRVRVPAFVRLVAAHSSTTGTVSTRLVRRLYRRLVTIAFRDPIELVDLAIDGDDLRTIGVGPGPELGRILQSLLAQVIDHPSRNSRDTLLTLATTMAASTHTS